MVNMEEEEQTDHQEVHPELDQVSNEAVEAFQRQIDQQMQYKPREYIHSPDDDPWQERKLIPMPFIVAWGNHNRKLNSALNNDGYYFLH